MGDSEGVLASIDESGYVAAGGNWSMDVGAAADGWSAGKANTSEVKTIRLFRRLMMLQWSRKILCRDQKTSENSLELWRKKRAAWGVYEPFLYGLQVVRHMEIHALRLLRSLVLQPM